MDISARTAAKPGDVITVHAHRLGEKPRQAKILEVLGEPGHEHYRVEWDDGRESIFYPSSDTALTVGAH
jgi:hypothetical protein